MVHGHGAWVQSVIRAYEPKLLRYAGDIVGSALARDVVQDTFLKLCAVERARVEAQLAGWLFTVCRNGALEVKRKVRRLSVLDELEHPSPAAAPGADLEQAQLMARVQRCLGSLTEQQRELVRLKFDGELSYKEMAAVTGLSVSNVGFILHTALARVRQELDREENVGVNAVRGNR
jgi:RNA polymerase sigma factor (sigma-70 family)